VDVRFIAYNKNPDNNATIPPPCTKLQPVLCGLRPSLTHHQGDEEVHAHNKGGAADGAATKGVQGANHEANVVESPQQGGHRWTSHAKVSQEMDTRSCTQEVERFQFGWR
jgi:hypothetical protein